MKFVHRDSGLVRFSASLHSKVGSMHVVRFVVKDNGPGMSPEFMQRMFQPFEQENPNMEGISGTGLGLSISYNMLRLMNGHIAVDSQVGNGTVFTIDVPLKPVASLGDVPQKAVVEKLSELSVLIVDDDLNTCTHTTALLNQVNVESEYTLSGIEAIEKVKRKALKKSFYDVVLVDWKMPEINGVETARRIRKIVGEDVTIIVMSAFDWTQIEAEAREAGVNYFICKPMFKEDIYELLKSIAFKSPKGKEAKRSTVTPFKGEKILLVEDNALNREIAKTLLEFNKLTVMCAADGQQAVDMFAKSGVGEISAVLMDVRMPVMDGLEATRIIRSMDRLDAQRVPIFALSANAFIDDIAKSMESGMNEHLSKPFNMGDLMKCLKKYLDK